MLVGAMIKAILLMCIAMSCIPAGDTASKVLTSQLDVAPGFVVWTRFLIGALVMLPFTWRAGLGVWRDWRVWARACLVALGISLITQAFRTEPVADVFGAFFIAPIISFVLSVVWLKERASLWQGILVLIGFFGVLFIVKPGVGASSGLWFAVAAGVCYGTFLTVSRWLSGQVALAGLMISQLVVPALVTAPGGVFAIPDLTWPIWGLVAASGLFSMAGNMLLIVAYKMQEASRLAPFVYAQLFSAVVLGWAVFGDLPDIWSIAGLCLIIGAGSASAWLGVARPVASRT